MADKGWYTDPSGRHEQRYFDGDDWTEHVADGGNTSIDAVDVAPPAPTVPVTSAPAPAVAPAAEGAGPRRTLWPWLVGIVVLAAVAVGAVVLLGGDDDDGSGGTGTSATTTTTTGAGSSTTAAPSTTGGSTATSAATATTTGSGAAGSQGNPAPLGTEQQIGDWKVAVIAFTPDATEAVKSMSEFNEDPTNGAYALVRLRMTYTGSETGNAVFDLAPGYYGSDKVFYEDSQCAAVVDDAVFQQPEVGNGGSIEANYCLDLPPAVLGTGAIFVHHPISFEDDGERWWRDR